jgi:hypothetical protein
MWFERFISSPRKNRPIRNRSKKAISARPMVEPLERRDLLDAFTAGSLIATVVGTGSAPLTGNATETFIKEYSRSGGAAIQSIGLPTTGAGAFTEKGTATNEGYLTTSADGHTASLAGYNIDAGSSTSATNSLIGIVNPDGSIDTTTVVPSGDIGGSVRAVASADGLGFWVATANYVRYVPFGNSTGTSAVTRWLQSPTTVEIGNGNLYFDGGAGAQSNGVSAIDGPVQISSGLPNVGGQSATILAGFPTMSGPNGFPTSNQFAVSPDGNTIFVADGRTNAGGGILEFYQLFPGSWINVNAGQTGFPIGPTGPDSGLLGLSVSWSGPGAPAIYATTTAVSGNRIVKITGGTTDGSTPAYVVTTLETADPNTAFRGVAFAPQAAGATATTTTLTVTGSPGSYPDAVTLSATVTGSSPTGYVSFQTASGVEIGAAPLISGTATLVPTSNLQVAESGSIVAGYTGDGANAASISAATTVTVTTDTTTTALTAQFTTVATGVPDNLTAQVSYAGSSNAAPTGTVTFWQDAVNTGMQLGDPVPLAQTIVNVGGNPTIEFLASTPATFSTTGLYHVFAVYSGDSNFQTSQGTQDVTVVLAATITVTTNNASPTALGDSVTLTATVTGAGATPTGTVAFYDNSLLIAANVALDSSGAANTTLTTSLLQQAGITLLPGLQSITAIYSGDATYPFPGSGVYEQAVQPQAFGAGDVFVYRVGDGTTGLIAPPDNPNAGTASIGSTIYVDEINPAGVNGSNVVQSIILPTADGQGDQASIHAIVGNGQQSATGQITVSGDGNYLFLVGYDTNPLSGATASGTGIGTTAAPIPGAPTGVITSSISRAVARIDMSGNVQDVAMSSSGSGSSSGNFNAVYSPDGNQFYVGGNGGVTYFSSFSPSSGFVTPAATMTSPTGTTAALEPMGPNLGVVGSGFGQGPVDAYIGLPMSAASPTASLTTGITAAAATAGGQASTFFIDAYFTHLDNAGGTAPAGINTMYLSDDGPGFSHGSITKWAMAADGTWTVVGVIVAGSGNSAISFYYLSGSTALDGPPGTLGNVTLYATYGNGGNSVTGPGELYQIIDTNGYNAVIGTGGTHSDAAPRVAHVSATSKEVYRGVAAFPVKELMGSPTPVTGVENVSTGLVEVATFTDPLDPGQIAPEDLGNFTVTIDWGDGAPLDTATLTADPDNVTYHVMGTHTYAQAGTYPITVTITETGMPGTLVVQSTATIDPAPVPAPMSRLGRTAGAGVAAGLSQRLRQAPENVEFTATVATFTYPVLFGGTAGMPMGFQATIDLGGATVPSILDPSLKAYTVAGAHTYVSDGQYTVSVTIPEGDISGDLVSSTATVDSNHSPTSGRPGGRG